MALYKSQKEIFNGIKENSIPEKKGASHSFFIYLLFSIVLSSFQRLVLFLSKLCSHPQFEKQLKQNVSNFSKRCIT